MLKILSFSLLVILLSCKSNQQAGVNDDATSNEGIAPVEFADAKYVDIGKSGLMALASNDIPKYMESFADNAVYLWNNGDSIVGKQAITEYWNQRRGSEITSLSFQNDIWLPVTVNTPANEYHTQGVWLLGWYQVSATYSNGKSMSQWAHTALHFNDSDKIDQVVHYLDREVITKASMPAKK
ncbi:MAG TPA: hypothetical protein PKC30_08780 [Saprospiraceae bacterium]|nr:hypothetical protein [Saprospiraceae bacterium]